MQRNAGDQRQAVERRRRHVFLDKTGTITLNRQASQVIAAPGARGEDGGRTLMLADEPRGPLIVAARARGCDVGTARLARRSFRSAYTRTAMDSFGGGACGGRARLGWRGCANRGESRVRRTGGRGRTDRAFATPLLARDRQVLGAIHLKDILKPNMKHRFDRLRAMGIKTVMITGDNPLTAASIAEEAGVDDFLAEATPQAKMDLIKREQRSGRLVAMTGDGTNDAPALAQADVGVAMNGGTQAAKEAANMVDLDSDPTKLIEIVEIGKQLLMTRGAITTFSIANDVAKYFAILPAMFATAYPAMNALNLMRLATPQSAILSAVIFNALIIIALIPLALRGVPYKPRGAEAVLRENVLIYGLGGLIVPFIGIKLIDLILTALHLT